MKRRFLPFVASACISGLAAGAQCPEWSQRFALRGVQGIQDFISFDDGSGPSLIIAGGFPPDTEGGALHIAEWDGERFSPLGGDLNNIARCLAVFGGPSGPELFAGGFFTQAGGLPANRVARWDGRQWSAVGEGMDNSVLDLVVFDDGSGPALYAGGSFTQAGGASAPLVAKWDGVLWSKLGSGPGSIGSTVHALAVFDDGTGPALYAGGDFTSSTGSADRVAKWNGVSWEPLGSGVDALVLTLLPHESPAGPVLVAGGFFQNAGGSPARSVAAWNGSSWSALGNGLDQYTSELATLQEGSQQRLYASIGAYNGLFRLEGATWERVAQGIEGLIYALQALDLGDGQKLYIGGSLLRLEPLATHGPATWDGQHLEVLVPGQGLARDVEALTVLESGDGSSVLVAGGRFSASGAEELQHVASFDGTAWSRMGNGLPGTVRSLTTFEDGTGDVLYAGGTFDMGGAEQVGRIARWDGSDWHLLGTELEGGSANGVRALATFDDGTGPALFAGGGFRQSDGVVLERVAKWNGASWSSLDQGVSGKVNALEVFDAGTGPALFVAGAFQSASGISAGRIAKWDGASWSALGSGLNGVAWALAVFDDASGGGPALFVGGEFDQAGGRPANRIARWDGSDWSSLGLGLDGAVFALQPFRRSGGFPVLAVGGAFAHAGGVPASGLAAWNGSEWAAFGSGAGGPVNALASFHDSTSSLPSLYLGGRFEEAGGLSSLNIAAWSDPCAPCGGDPLPLCQGETNSMGCTSFLSVSGSPSASLAEPFLIRGENVLPGQSGFMIYAFKKSSLSFHGGTLCVMSPFRRWLPAKAASSSGTTACGGVLERNFNKRIQNGSDAQLTAGATVIAQWLQRDPNDPGGFVDNLTNGVRFSICP
jgi:hypothetical protein